MLKEKEQSERQEDEEEEKVENEENKMGRLEEEGEEGLDEGGKEDNLTRPYLHKHFLNTQQGGKLYR